MEWRYFHLSTLAIIPKPSLEQRADEGEPNSAHIAALPILHARLPHPHIGRLSIGPFHPTKPILIYALSYKPAPICRSQQQDSRTGHWCSQHSSQHHGNNIVQPLHAWIRLVCTFSNMIYFTFSAERKADDGFNEARNRQECQRSEGSIILAAKSR